MYHMILMAAGRSSRFGENKLLYELHGQPVYLYGFNLLRRYLSEYPDETEVVVVTRFDEIATTAREAGFNAAWNPRPEDGLSLTIRLGVDACYLRDEEREGYVFFTADQPYLRYESLLRFMTAVNDSTVPLLTMASVKRLGNPCYFSASLQDELRALTGDQGGRLIMARRPELKCEQVLVADNELDDIDEPSQIR